MTCAGMGRWICRGRADERREGPLRESVTVGHHPDLSGGMILSKDARCPAGREAGQLLTHATTTSDVFVASFVKNDGLMYLWSAPAKKKKDPVFFQQSRPACNVLSDHGSRMTVLELTRPRPM